MPTKYCGVSTVVEKAELGSMICKVRSGNNDTDWSMGQNSLRRHYSRAVSRLVRGHDQHRREKSLLRDSERLLGRSIGKGTFCDQFSCLSLTTLLCILQLKEKCSTNDADLALKDGVKNVRGNETAKVNV